MDGVATGPLFYGLAGRDDPMGYCYAGGRRGNAAMLRATTPLKRAVMAINHC